MTEKVILALISEFVPTLTILAAVFGTWWQQRKKVEEVHGIVNSKNDALTARVEALGAEILRLHLALAQMSKSK